MLENSVTAGVIGGIRDFEGYRLLQMDAAVSKGNSGGPVVNERGEVIGITVLKLTAGESLNFAIPINYARGMLQMPTGLGLSGLAGLPQVGSMFSDPTQGFPKRWKSLISGTTKILRISGDRLYIETYISEEFSKSGGMHLAELQKQGDKWVGTTRSRIHCWWLGESKPCSFEYEIEITSLTPTRIEGTVMSPPEGAKLRCGSCRYSGDQRRVSFSWIPE